MSDTTQPTPTDVILVVDDSHTNRFLLRSILNAAGYKVEECEDGEECLNFCASKLPKMILLDVMMPRVDGIEACSTLRRQYSKEQLPIIMVTTKAEGVDIAAGLDAGANDYVTKPINKDSLVARIVNQLAVIEDYRTAKERSEASERALDMQRAIGDIFPDGVFLHDEQGEILYMNKAFRSACASDLPERLDGVWGVLFSAALHEIGAKWVKEIEVDDALNIDEEIEIPGPRLQVFHVTSRPIRLEDDTLLRTWVCRDLTHMRELERRSKQQIRLDTVGVFAAGVAHNFNNLLGSVLGATELLDRFVGEDARARRCLSVIRKAVASGSKLTKKMAAVVREDLSSKPGEENDLLEIVDSVVEVQRELVEFDPNRSVDFLVEGEGTYYLNLSTRNIIDVIANLVSNGVDAIEGEGELRVLVEEEAEDRFVTIRIIDSGRGMDLATQQKIYEPFYSTKNLDVENNVSMEGNGLGLWNVYNLVTNCGGTMAFKSVPGEGTEVRVTLPLREQFGHSSEGESAPLQ